jgi:phosphomannomutase
MCAKAPAAARRRAGKLEERDVLASYAEHVARFAQLDRPLEIAVDASNGMAGHTLPPILERLPAIRAHALFMELDGTFPNHEANPLKEANLDPCARSCGAEAPIGDVLRRRRRPLLLRRRGRAHGAATT